MNKILKKIIIGFIAVILVIVLIFVVYTNDYYHASYDLSTYVENSELSIVKKNGIIALDGDPTNQNGIIFYPGGKVDELAYIPLLEDIAEQGYDCYLVNFPFNLAVFDINAADKVLASYQASNWYLMGHSLGGAMASSYISKNADIYRGLILLGAYPASDLKDTDLQILEIIGTEDGVVNRENLEESNKYLNSVAIRYDIQGGNHAYFGDYGLQAGDKLATITSDEQKTITTEEVVDFIKD